MLSYFHIYLQKDLFLIHYKAFLKTIFKPEYT